jgi:outer membrane lipoprotein-sorting protein
MATRKNPLPQNVQLLQRRFEDAQRTFEKEFQQRVTEYTGTMEEYGEKIEDYSAKAQEYLDRVDDYAKYMESFFITPGSTKPEQFINYGGKNYWVEDVAPNFDLRGIEGLGELSGSEYQFVKTGSKPHTYTYSEQVWVTSGRYETVPYTEYETRTVSTPTQVWVPANSINTSSPSYSFGSTGSSSSGGYSFANIGTNVQPGYSTGGLGGVGGYYETRNVVTTERVAVTKYKQQWVDTSKFETQFRAAASNLDVGYLRTRTSEGGFTTLKPEDFPEKQMPEGDIGEAPEAPEVIDISDIRGGFEREKEYFQRAVGQVKSASQRARRRLQVRPLTQGT